MCRPAEDKPTHITCRSKLVRAPSINKWQRNDGPGINYRSAIRQGDWKLIYNMRDRSMELYNLKTDIGETTDLAAQNPEKVKDLATKLSRQLKQWNAPMPVIKETGKSVPLPGEALNKTF